MKILAIETSCDETAAAIVEEFGGSVQVLSEAKATSEEMHVKTGGVVPEVASREQLKAMIPVVKKALTDAFGGDREDLQNQVDALAVTVGPGLIGSLLVGVETAKALSLAWEKPLIPVNHLVGHLYANWVGKNPKQFRGPKIAIQKETVPQFPAVGLVVSGGHTELVLMKRHPWQDSRPRGQKAIEVLGSTRDDAAGECLDKCARVLGLPYPGGASISKMATQYQKTSTKLQTNFTSQVPNTKLSKSEVDGYDFSFSGLKAAFVREAMIYDLRRNSQESSKWKQRLAWELQEVVVESLVSGVVRVVKEFRPKSVLLAGGVAANARLREHLKLQISSYKFNTDVFVPKVEYCTDNAVMVGAAAVYSNTPLAVEKVKADPDLGLE